MSLADAPWDEIMDLMDKGYDLEAKQEAKRVELQQRKHMKEAEVRAKRIMKSLKLTGL